MGIWKFKKLLFVCLVSGCTQYSSQPTGAVIGQTQIPSALEKIITDTSRNHLGKAFVSAAVDSVTNSSPVETEINYRVTSQAAGEDGDVTTKTFLGTAFVNRDAKGWRLKKIEPRSQELSFERGLTIESVSN